MSTHSFCGGTSYLAGQNIQLPEITVLKGEGEGKKAVYLSFLWVSNSGVAEVTALPFRVEAVAL